MHTTPTELLELFGALVAESAQVNSLGRPQREAWVSGLLSTWRGDVVVKDTAATDAEFRAYCVALETEVGAALVSSLDAISPGAVPTRDTQWLAVDAWSVAEQGPSTKPGACSYIIGFSDPTAPTPVAPNPEEPDDLEVSDDHSLLAEVVDGRLIDLNFGAATGEIVPDPELLLEEMGRQIAVQALDVRATAQMILDAWVAAGADDARGDIDDLAERPGLLLNQMVAASRLRCAVGDPTLGGVQLPEFVAARAEALSFTEGMSDEEVAEANGWAQGVLASAIRRVSWPELSSVDASLRDEMITTAAGPIRGPIDHLDTKDQRALCFLEWADWLGVIIGLARGGAGLEVTPASLVRLVNTCPEVSTDVPPADREYVEYSFSVAITMWEDAGVVADGQLTPAGHGALVPAVQQAWT